MNTAILVAGAMVLMAGLVAVAISLWFTYERSRLRVTDVENDNEDAIRHFLTVLGEAKRELLVHDDGDKIKGSLYDDEAAVQAVRERLRACPELEIRCLLNYKDDLTMVDLSEEYGSRFQVRYLHQRPVDDIHFKIADGGKMAYLSTHPRGVVERKGKVIEGVDASERVRKNYLGGLIDDFNEGFHQAHSA